MYHRAGDLDYDRAHCAALDVALGTWITALQAINWPTGAAADARKLIHDETRADTHFRSCAGATTRQAWDEAWQAAGRREEDANSDGAVVRHDLGLNPLPD
jgi:hypothetical protein